jgi:4-carboxymuconolactone decarboxylase
MPRLTELFKREELPEDKRWVHDYLIETRGKVSNGYAPYLHNPDYVSAISHLGSYIRYGSTLPQEVYEILSLTVSAELDNPYEADNHALITAKMGLPQAMIDSIRSKQALTEATEDQTLWVRCAREMVREHRLSDESFEAARQRLGARGVIDLIGTIGYYSMLMCVHNGMQVRGPA